MVNLPPRLRQVIIRKEQGMTVAEIAVDLGITVEAVNARLKRAALKSS